MGHSLLTRLGNSAGGTSQVQTFPPLGQPLVRLNTIFSHDPSYSSFTQG